MLATIIVIITPSIPRISVDASGDLSNPASISFKMTNGGSLLPLHYPIAGLFLCEIGYGNQNTKPFTTRECNIPNLPDAPDQSNTEWFYTDDTITARLEDYVYITNNPLVTLNVIVRVSYYFWYYPFHSYRFFGFKSEIGVMVKCIGEIILPTQDHPRIILGCFDFLTILRR